MPSAKKRGGLGRGLNALVSEAEYETGGSAVSASNAASETKLPIEDIVPNPNQPRIHFNETELRELSESIQEHGVLQPLLVMRSSLVSVVTRHQSLLVLRNYLSSLKMLMMKRCWLLL